MKTRRVQKRSVFAVCLAIAALFAIGGRPDVLVNATAGSFILGPATASMDCLGLQKPTSFRPPARTSQPGAKEKEDSLFLGAGAVGLPVVRLSTEFEKNFRPANIVVEKAHPRTPDPFGDVARAPPSIAVL